MIYVADGPGPTSVVLRCWCTNAIAMLPSPTAAATRFTELQRTGHALIGTGPRDEPNALAPALTAHGQLCVMDAEF